jgi:hypothetical protein
MAVRRCRRARCLEKDKWCGVEGGAGGLYSECGVGLG